MTWEGSAKFSSFIDEAAYRFATEGEVEEIESSIEPGVIFMRLEGPLDALMEYADELDLNDDQIEDLEEATEKYEGGAIIKEDEDGVISVKYYRDFDKFEPGTNLKRQT